MKLDPSQQAAQRQFDSRSAEYGTSHVLANTEDVEMSLANISLKPGMKALDIATGGGHTGLFLARRGLHVTFSDISAEMLERVSDTLAKEGLSGEVKHHPAEVLPYADESFDIVSSRVAPHHFSDPAEFVHSSARVLKPGGHFLLIDIVSSDEDRETADWGNRIEKLRDPSHVRNYTRSEWVKWVESSGLHVIFGELFSLKQTDLEHYFAVADTPAENRKEIYAMIHSAPQKAKEIFRLNTDDDGRITWWWQRLRLLAQK
ncbi:MAG: methyltransferase domain-containing protein, partial [Chthoniobacterales bacterium]